MSQIKVGDAVSWTSGKNSKEKRGRVVAVVNKNENPAKHFPTASYDTSPMYRSKNQSRPYISFLVLVDKKLYWPYPHLLRKTR